MTQPASSQRQHQAHHIDSILCAPAADAVGCYGVGLCLLSSAGITLNVTCTRSTPTWPASFSVNLTATTSTIGNSPACGAVTSSAVAAASLALQPAVSYAGPAAPGLCASEGNITLAFNLTCGSAGATFNIAAAANNSNVVCTSTPSTAGGGCVWVGVAVAAVGAGAASMCMRCTPLFFWVTPFLVGYTILLVTPFSGLSPPSSCLCGGKALQAWLPQQHFNAACLTGSPSTAEHNV